jgi:hypothetical protein
MARRRGAFASGLALVLFFSVGLGAQLDKKTEDAIKKEAQALQKLADAALVAQGGANDFNLTWVKEDFLRGTKDKQFVPFTITLDPTKVSGALALYYRVVPTPAPGVAVDPKKPVKPVWESIFPVTVAADQNPMRLSRSFSAEAGSYDVYLVAKEVQPDRPKNAPPAKTVVLKQTVNVPNFWNEELSTSSVLVYQRIEPLAAPLNAQQQAERPYAMGTAEIIPFPDMKLSKQAELATLLFIYNPKGDSANKPDVTIEYNFCQIAPGTEPKPDEPCKTGEKFFNKTEPEALNGTTLDPAFDVKVMPIQTGQAVPLAAFPPGDYRLEIKVVDKLANKTITRDVNFSVTAS